MLSHYSTTGLTEYILLQLHISYDSIHKGAMRSDVEVMQPLLASVNQISKRNCSC